LSGAPPLALVIDTCALLNLKIKHKKQNNSLFGIILFFNNMSAFIPTSPLRTFHAPQFNKPGFGLFIGH